MGLHKDYIKAELPCVGFVLTGKCQYQVRVPDYRLLVPGYSIIQANQINYRVPVQVPSQIRIRNPKSALNYSLPYFHPYSLPRSCWSTPEPRGELSTSSVVDYPALPASICPRAESVCPAGIAADSVNSEVVGEKGREICGLNWHYHIFIPRTTLE